MTVLPAVSRSRLRRTRLADNFLKSVSPVPLCNKDSGNVQDTSDDVVDEPWVWEAVGMMSRGQSSHISRGTLRNPAWGKAWRGPLSDNRRRRSREAKVEHSSLGKLAA